MRPGLRLQLLSAEHFGQLVKAAPSFATQLPVGLVLPKQRDGKDELGEKLQTNAEPKRYPSVPCTVTQGRLGGSWMELFRPSSAGIPEKI